MKNTIIAATLAALAGSASAATISWSSTAYTTNGSAGQNLDTGLFLTTGTEFLVENVGGAATTFDGIDFTADSGLFGSAIANTFHASSSDLSDSGRYGSSGADTISLSGLTIGQTYRIQALVFDGRGSAGITGRTVSFDGIDQGQYANGVSGVTWGDGLLVTGTFTADATDQDFTIEAFDGASSVGGQLNALLVHNTTAIPEPTSTAFVGLAGLGLLLRRRR
ncbi:PEP-CTERM protein-sorting domain-containing protein/Myxococcales GC_trans_RRR domain-containing protein/MYXO-CTERM domain-containing protein [Rubritalea squalenifaciens DSM 18772]|uniref:PEP-CTERM protein-sorting domain-containing protein/Myxococcales GC_trans_RRR domain-containing protein/MYXO-CTERM domain-containing protein n=1 Tax=Rubritalea squalenifaciens DSM 18772 TaxID=1123071 RepID=A0A1M6SDB2_9BACT|nr:PEP-CTERM sorting domain-containing protein [Rubritalea squalenifaciens]SHK42665.1 PEP-CTERM protein-sorting domain-containing protein/Myxococcales GC_trans_RRR domain-containing protein/MYXO-CTERM domain-containing protein [Rubritalea squalenifaciens DSM 18772]